MSNAARSPRVLYEAQQRAIGINQRPDSQATILQPMQAWCVCMGLREACSDAACKENIQVIDSEAAAEAAGYWIDGGIREELNNKAAALKDHPSFIAPAFREAERAVELRGYLEIPGGKIGCRVIHR